MPVGVSWNLSSSASNDASSSSAGVEGGDGSVVGDADSFGGDGHVRPHSMWREVANQVESFLLQTLTCEHYTPCSLAQLIFVGIASTHNVEECSKTLRYMSAFGQFLDICQGVRHTRYQRLVLQKNFLQSCLVFLFHLMADLLKMLATPVRPVLLNFFHSSNIIVVFVQTLPKQNFKLIKLERNRGCHFS